MSTILHATAAVRGSASSASAVRASQSGARVTSGLTRATVSTSASRAANPRLAAAAKPVLWPSSSTRTPGRAAARAAEPSTEPLSTTRISAGAAVWADRESRQPSSQRAPFQFGITTAAFIGSRAVQQWEPSQP